MLKKWKERQAHWDKMVQIKGADILKSSNMQKEKKFMQHGKVSVYSHSIKVAALSLFLAELFRLKVNRDAMMRGALLHDYFLYDWHEKDASHRLHGFSHARTALKNAKRDFELNAIEVDVIQKHMFPLNLKPPKYKESALVCIADKISALEETIHRKGDIDE